MSSVYTTPTSAVGPGLLYLCGGHHFQPGGSMVFSKKVYRYEIDDEKLPNELANAKQCSDTKVSMLRPICVPIVDDRAYFLGHAMPKYFGGCDNDSLAAPILQEYDLKEDKWSLVECDGDDIIGCNVKVLFSFGEAPHVVIGDKLHISLGASSFAFDTVKRSWEKSKLFEKYWYHSDFCWMASIEPMSKLGGPPFQFDGKGIILEKNILLGIHNGLGSFLVAFLLDEVEGKVVRTQPLFSLGEGASLVDLGQAGYFGIVHFLPQEYEHDGSKKYSEMTWDHDWDKGVYVELCMELKIFQISKLPQRKGAASDDDKFLKCRFVRKDIVANHLQRLITMTHDHVSCA